MSKFSLSEKHRSLQAAETFIHLQMVDDLRTSSQESEQEGDDVEVQTFQALTKEEDQLLLETAHRAQSLREIITKRPKESEQAYEEALVSFALTNEQKTQIQRLVGQAGGFLAFAQNATKGLEEAIPDTRKQLASDPQNISQGAIRPFLSKAFFCNVAAGIFIGGCFTGNPFVAAFGLGLALGADC